MNQIYPDLNTVLIYINSFYLLNKKNIASFSVMFKAHILHCQKISEWMFSDYVRILPWNSVKYYPAFARHIGNPHRIT